MNIYRVEANTDYDAFCNQVQEAVRTGWSPQGDELVVEGKYVQCFIRFEELQ